MHKLVVAIASPQGKYPQKGKGMSPQKASGFLGNKKNSGQKWKGNGKEKVQEGANVLLIMDVLKLSKTSSESINFSCYNTSETAEWFLDSGCMEHITPEKSNFIQYREFGQKGKAEITDGKYLEIEGCGTVIRHSIMPDRTVSMQI